MSGIDVKSELILDAIDKCYQPQIKQNVLTQDALVQTKRQIDVVSPIQ